MHDDDITPGLIATVRGDRMRGWGAMSALPATVTTVQRNAQGRVVRIDVRIETSGVSRSFTRNGPRGRIFRDGHSTSSWAGRFVTRLVLGTHPPIGEWEDIPF